MSAILSWLRTFLLLCGVLVANMPAALAQSGTAPGAATRKFEEGSKAFDAGRFQEALRLLSSSMELEPSPNTRYLMARCYVALGKTASAYNHFKRAAQEADDRVSATNEKRYAATRAAALAKVKELEAKVPRLTLQVPSEGLPARLSWLRQERGLSRRQLGRLSGTSDNFVQMTETGTTVPNIAKVEQLAKALEVSVCWLAFGAGSPELPVRRRPRSDTPPAPSPSA